MQLCCTFRRVQLFTFVVAVSSIASVLMILFLFNYPSIARRRIIDAMVFRNNTDSMDRFLTTAEIKNLRVSFYMYNVTNAIDVINSGAKINLQEIGPFVYSEYKYKELLDNNQTSGLITYKLRTRYKLLKDLSIADPQTTMITWINVPLIVAKSFLDKLPFFQKEAAYWAINKAISHKNEGAFITDSVENFLFDGSKRELFQYLEDLDVFKLINPWPLKDNKFGLLFGRNDTWNPQTDTIMTVSAGFGLNQSYSNLNQFVYVNGSSTLPFWQSQPPDCNTVGGTDGEFFAPFVDLNQELEVYSPTICRKLTFTYRQSSSVKGINSLEYSMNNDSLKSGHKLPENQCYCLNLDTTSECLYDGLIDLSKCAFPNVMASGARFFAGSPELSTRVTGLQPPNSTLHEPTILVEPNTGLSIKVKVPLQFNVKLERSPFKIFKFFNDNQSLILPLVYVVESSEVTDEQSSLLRSKLLLLDSWFVSMVLCGTIVFIIVIFVTANILFIKCRRPRQVHPDELAPEREPLLNSTLPSDEVQEDDSTTRSTTNRQTNNYQTL